MSAVAAIHPQKAIEGGRITIEGSGFPIGDDTYPPAVRIGGARARVIYASTTRLVVVVPAGLDGGRALVSVGDEPEVHTAPGAAQGSSTGGPASVEIAAPFATGLHQVDNPVFDLRGNL